MPHQQAKAKVVLVTGGSDGIGAATALAFAQIGCNVAITGRSQAKLDAVTARLAQIQPPIEYLALQADFEDMAQIDSVMAQTLRKFGQLDVFVNNAGYSGRGLGIEHPEFFSDFQNIIQVNLIAATRMAQLAVEPLKKNKGVIINVTSISDRMPMPSVSYSVSKAGLSMLTKTLANGLEGTGIRVVGVAPGPVRTSFSSPAVWQNYDPHALLGRCGESNEVADLIIFLASDKASYVHGTNVDIDGGFSIKCGNVYDEMKCQMEAATKAAKSEQS